MAPSKKKAKNVKVPGPKRRQVLLVERRNLKMARSPHAFVRGSTERFYQWLAEHATSLPEGPAVWICGDCHVGNLGPIANADGRTEIQIRDLDQSVIGNPAHDLVRLGLSLASAARGNDLPGVITVKMLEQLVEGYADGMSEPTDLPIDTVERPEAVHAALRTAVRRSWTHVARDRIGGKKRSIPLGKQFWPLSKTERAAVEALFADRAVQRLVTFVQRRDEKARVRVADAAYWVKGCSSLGRLRVAVLTEVQDDSGDRAQYGLLDIKEAIAAAAPHYAQPRMPREHAERVSTGARALSPHLGERMLAARLLRRSVFVRELLPQDLKIEIERMREDDAERVARFLAAVVGRGHARQLDSDLRRRWLTELRRNRSKSLDAPSWLWSSVVELNSVHDAAYLEHCRRYATERKRRAPRLAR